jgi:chromosome segregation ATPase
MDEIKSEVKQVQHDYLEILNDILHKLLEKGKFQELDTTKDLSIYVGNQSKYKGHPDGEVSVNSMTPELVDKINTAINDPQNLKGSIRIMIGKDKVYHVKDGEVLTDKLGLNNQINRNQSQSQQASKSIQQSSPIEDLQKQVEALQQKVQQQQGLIDNFSAQHQSSNEVTQKLSADLISLKQAFDAQQKTIEQLQKGLEAINNQNHPALNNSTLHNWINSIETKAKNTARNLYEQVKTALTPKVDKVKAQLETQITALREQMNQQMESLKTEMKSQVAAIKSEFESQVGVVKDGIGEVKQIVSDEIQHGMERHQAAIGAIHTKVSEEVNTVHKQITQAVADIHSATNHTVKQNVEKVTSSAMDIKGKALAKDVNSMLHLFGNQHPDGSRSYESKNYNFYQKGDSITVTAKDGRAVMVDSDLTTEATQNDVESLEEVQEVVSDYLKHTKTQSQSTKLKR